MAVHTLKLAAIVKIIIYSYKYYLKNVKGGIVYSVNFILFLIKHDYIIYIIIICVNYTKWLQSVLMACMDIIVPTSVVVTV